MKFGDKTVEVLNPNVIRIYLNKNDTSLFELNDVTKITGDGAIIEIKPDENGLITVVRNGKEVFKEKNPGACGKTFKTCMACELSGSDDKIYGLGDKVAFLNRRGYEFISWNSDIPEEHNESFRSLYKSINYLLVNKEDDEWFGIFYPSSYKCTFDLGYRESDTLMIGTEKGEYDYFVFLGNNPQAVTRAYYSLIGKQLFTPLKFLGNHQSRWSYTKEEALEILDKHNKEGFPLDYIHFDIDYMKGYRVYTVSEEYLPDFKGLADKLSDSGVGIITIVDPAVKLDESGYKVFDDLRRMKGFATKDGKEYVNAVWPGDAEYPDYFRSEVRRYLTDTTREFIEKYNLSGIWGDMNEPASFNGPLPDDVEFLCDDDKVHFHDEVHNLYAEYMSKTLAAAFTERNLRPTLITRAAFATTTRYTTSWNGDNQSLWAHLEGSLPQVMTMNMCGFAMNGVDVGGFGCMCTKELLIRWCEANIFMPYFRNHSTTGSRHQEPWAFDSETFDIYKKFLNLRYMFIPYLYDLSWAAHNEGIPMFAPLFWHYPTDARVKEINDEVMVGSLILHAPIVKQGAKSRLVYFPEGRWVDYHTGNVYEGGKEYIVKMPLDCTGIFIKEGALIPTMKECTSLKDGCPDTIYIYAAKGNDSANINYLPYESHIDDGKTLDYEKGVYNTYRITCDEQGLHTECIYNGYSGRTEYVRKCSDL